MQSKISSWINTFLDIFPSLLNILSQLPVYVLIVNELFTPKNVSKVTQRREWFLFFSSECIFWKNEKHKNSVYHVTYKWSSFSSVRAELEHVKYFLLTFSAFILIIEKFIRKHSCQMLSFAQISFFFFFICVRFVYISLETRPNLFQGKKIREINQNSLCISST